MLKIDVLIYLKIDNSHFLFYTYIDKVGIYMNDFCIKIVNDIYKTMN